MADNGFLKQLDLESTFIGGYDSLDEIPKNKCIPGNIVIVDKKMYYASLDGWNMVDYIFGDGRVLTFIKNFSKDNNETIVDLFSNGYCYWFARILKERFNGIIVYNAIYNHFACAIDGNIYDIKGYICKYDESKISMYMNWEKFKEIEHAESARIYRDCILKIPSEFEIDYKNKTCNGELLKIYNEEEELK